MESMLHKGDPLESTKLAANRMSEIAGIWEFLATFGGIPARNSSDPLQRKPLEIASTHACSAFSNICMAQAEELGAANSLAKSAKTSLVGKLFLQSSTLYKEASRHLELLSYSTCNK